MRPILWLLVLCVAHSVAAQNKSCDIRLQGRVIDSHDESALSFATVAIVDSPIQTVADVEGYFVIDDLCPGIYELVTHHIGCEPVNHTIRISKGGVNEFVFRMEHHRELHEVEVAAKAIDVTESSQTIRIKDNALQLAMTRGLSKAAESVGGVSSLKSGPNISKPQIHGVTGNRIAIYQEGVQLQDQQWGDEHAPAMETADIGALIVVRGADGIEYGSDAIGGAIIAQPADFENNQLVSGNVRITAASNGRGGAASAMVSGAVTDQKRLRYRFSGGLQRFGDRSSARYLLTNTGDNHRFASAALQYNFKTLRLGISQSWVDQEYGILRDAHVGNLTDLQLAIDRDNPFIADPFGYEIVNPRQRVTHAMTQVTGAIKPGKSSQLEWIYGFQNNDRREFDIRRGPYYDQPAVDMNLRTHDAVLKYIHVLNASLNVKAGLEGEWQQNFSDPETGTRAIVPNYKRNRYGAFARLKWESGNWRASFGVRHDRSVVNAYKWYRTSLWESLEAGQFDQFVSSYNESGNQVFVEPTLHFNNTSAVVGVDRFWSENFQTGLQVSWSSRPPNSAELFSDGVHLSAATVEYGDLGLNNEEALSIGINGKFKNERIKLYASGVYRHFKSFILPEINGLEVTIRGAFPQLEYNQVEAFFVGTQWEAEFALTPTLNLRHNGSTLYAQDLDRYAPLPAISPTQFRNELVWRKALSGGTSIEISVGVHSALEKRYAPRAISPENLAELFAESLDEEREKGAFDITPPPGEFHLLNAVIRADIPWGARSISVAIAGDNLLNRPYRNYLNRFRYYADETGINLQLFLNLKF